MPNLPADGELRILVVDDEPLGRDRLRAALVRLPGIRIVGECVDGASAVEAIRAEGPDLVLLDIQMPGVDGFGVIAAVGADAMPPVIFVTAFDEFALRAFEVHALDYLLKPFDDARLHAALARARASRESDEASVLARRLRGLLDQLGQAEGREERQAGAGRYARRLMVRRGDTMRYVALSEVEWIEAADNYVRLHVGAETHLVRMSLRDLESRLDPAAFVRIHRSTIVRFSAIREIQPWYGGDYTAILHNGRELRVSRSYKDNVIRTVL